MHKSGYLELFIGPMYAGKSTELIRMIRRYQLLKKNIFIINHSINNRYGSNGITTHNRECVDNVHITDKLASLEETNEFKNADVIIIEELQFFPDAYDCIVRWCDELKKCVVAAGLDGDSNRKPFGDVLRLIPHAEKVVKLSALCKKCGDGTQAFFSKRFETCKESNPESNVLVGSDEYYEAVCRKHFLENE